MSSMLLPLQVVVGHLGAIAFARKVLDLDFLTDSDAEAPPGLKSALRGAPL
jgi:hypothetical protein